MKRPELWEYPTISNTARSASGRPPATSWADRQRKEKKIQHHLDFDPTAGFNIYALEWDERAIKKCLLKSRARLAIATLER